MSSGERDRREDQEDQQARRDGNAVQITVLVAATVVIVSVLGGAVALSLAGRDAGVIAALIGPTAAAAGLLVAALGKLVQLDRKQDAQTAKLEQVEHQTNGGMAEQIDASVKAAIAEALADRQP